MGAIVGWKQGTIVFLSLLFVSFFSLSVLAVTFEYNEGELVRLLPEAEDDGTVVFRFSSPLDDNGEWQTTFDDAGTYDVTITADDGELTTIERVELIINNVNQPPVVKVRDVSVDEGDLVDIVGTIEDPDNDNLVVSYSAPLDENGRWQTMFGDAGVYIADIKVSDGEFNVDANITITIGEKNQAPIITSTSPPRAIVEIDEGTDTFFSVSVDDGDGDELFFTWIVDDAVREESSSEFVYHSDFNDNGTHSIMVEVSDGVDMASNEWTLVISNVNRAPVIDVAEFVIDEGETFSLSLPREDEDGDVLEYTYSDLFDRDGFWTPTFDDAGAYTVIVTASDGEFEVTNVITITVTDVDRAPVIQPIDDLRVAENDIIEILLDAVDPDGDVINFTANGLDGGMVEGNVLSWTTSFDTVTIPNNFFSRIIKRVRLDTFIYGSERDFDIVVNACGVFACSTEEFTVTVENVNRLPVIDHAETVIVREGETVSLSPVASDADDDYVTMNVAKPFNREWSTDFESAGEYYTVITAYDGRETVEKEVHIVVQNVNRAPTFEKINDYDIKEGEELSFQVAIRDPDVDNISLVVEELPRNAGLRNGLFTWMPDYDTVERDEGKKEFLITFSATDHPLIVPVDISVDAVDNATTATQNETQNIVVENGVDIFTVKKSIIITVENVNQVPEIVAPQRITALVGEPVLFQANVTDGDGDELSYFWKFGLFNGVKNPTAVRRVFTRPGEKKISVVVSDGNDKVKHTWLVTVAQPAQ
jgi:PKD repeat protein